MKRHSCMELMACSWPLRGPGAQRNLIPCMRPGPPTQASATFRQTCANAPQGSPRLRCRMLVLRLAEAIGIGLLREGGVRGVLRPAISTRSFARRFAQRAARNNTQLRAASRTYAEVAGREYPVAGMHVGPV